MVALNAKECRIDIGRVRFGDVFISFPDQCFVTALVVNAGIFLHFRIIFFEDRPHHIRGLGHAKLLTALSGVHVDPVDISRFIIVTVEAQFIQHI
jgi:hypothetical protein